MNVLVTGGAGYIGSHVVYDLLNGGHKVFVIDRDKKACDHLKKKLSRRKKLTVYCGDVEDNIFTENILSTEDINAVIHLAAFISVRESVEDPVKYFYNNTAKTIKLLSLIEKYKIPRFIFSSTAAVYGDVNQEDMPLTEESSVQPANPYGMSKLLVEHVVEKMAEVNDEFSYVAFRYFNVAGNDVDSRVTDPRWREKENLVPCILKYALGETDEIKIFGSEYDTADGTCIRDYIHVSDIANAHSIALTNGNGIYNLGSGKGSSVMEVVGAMNVVTGGVIRDIVIAPARKGDVPFLVATAKKWQDETGWTPIYDIDEIVLSAWKSVKNS